MTNPQPTHTKSKKDAVDTDRKRKRAHDLEKIRNQRAKKAPPVHQSSDSDSAEDSVSPPPSKRASPSTSSSFSSLKRKRPVGADLSGNVKKKVVKMPGMSISSPPKGKADLVVPAPVPPMHTGPPFATPIIPDREAYYTPVRVTPGGTAFPMDYLAPAGLGISEYSSIQKAMREKGIRARVSTIKSGNQKGTCHNDPRIAPIAANLKLRNVSAKDEENIRKNLDKSRLKKETYITPDSHTARDKYARFLFRTDTVMPDKFPFTFAPHSHSVEFGVKTGYETENVIVGTLASGHSCTLRLTGYRPYIYLEIPKSMQKLPDLSAVCGKMLVFLNAAVKANLKGRNKYLMGNLTKDLVSTTPHLTQHINCRTYRGSETSPFLKVYVLHPNLIRDVQHLLQAPGGKTVSLLDGFGERCDPKVWLPEAFRMANRIPDYMTVMEAHVDYSVRIGIDLGLFPAGIWFVYNTYPVMPITKNAQISQSNIEITSSYENIRAATETYYEKNLPNVIDGKFDIEARTEGKRFPHPDTDDVVIVVMRFRFGHLGQAVVEEEETLIDTPMPSGETIRKPGCTVALCFCLGSTAPSRKYSAISFSNEADMLMAVHEALVVIQPDYLAGHASDIFDFVYLIKRAAHLKLGCFPFFARLFKEEVTNNSVEKSYTKKDGTVVVSQSKKQTTKKGIFRPITRVPGVVIWDSLKYVRDFMFEKTASLNALSAKYLKKQKIDVEYSFISKLMETESGRTLLCKYCNYDVVLLELLDDKVGALKFLHEMANLCNVPLQMLGDRASTFRIAGLWAKYTQRYFRYAFPHKEEVPGSLDIRSSGSILPETGNRAPHSDAFLVRQMRSVFGDKLDPNIFRDKNLCDVFFLTPTPNSFQEASNLILEKYDGGTVLKPIRGLLEWLATLDFKSLYPSIMIALNICFITVLKPGTQKMVCDIFGLDIDKDLWHEPRFMLSDDGLTTKPYIDMATKPSYVRPHVAKGIICYIEAQILESRQISKDTMEGYYTKAKTEMNPVIKAGFLLLAGVYNLRQMAKKIMCNSIYGGLGMGGGSLALRMSAETITNLSRQALEFTRYTVARTIRKSRGWKFNAVIIYGDSVSGDTTLVIRRGGLSGYPTTIRIDELVSNSEWAPYRDGMKESVETPDLEVWQDGGFTPVKRIIRHMCKKKMVRVLTLTGIVDCTEDHSLLKPDGVKVCPGDVTIGDNLLHASDKGLISILNTPYISDVTTKDAFEIGLFMAGGQWGGYKRWFYNAHGGKRIPSDILCGSLDVIQEFWRGFWFSGVVSADLNGKEMATGIWLIGRRLGWCVTISSRSNDLNTFHLDFVHEDDGGIPTSDQTIREIQELPLEEGYVFDLETESHHFHVGPGDLVVHNTDSVFVGALDVDIGDITGDSTISPTEKQLKYFMFDEFQKICDEQNKLLPEAMCLQMEKFSIRGVTNTPKCYALRMSEGKEKSYFTKASGMSSVRRGGCKLQREMCEKIIKELVENGDKKAAIEIVRKTVRRVLERDLKQHEILMRSSLSKSPEDYVSKDLTKKYTPPPHVIMAKKIMKRGGAPMRAGDRVYFIVVPGPPKAKVSERVETPNVVLESCIEYDMDYYLDLVMKEAKKTLRTIVDTSSFAEKFILSDWQRQELGKPGGKALVKKAENKQKDEMDKRVESVILHGKDIDFSLEKKPSFYDLPEDYQRDLPDIDWHWAGHDPERKVPHISTYNPPWFKNKGDRQMAIDEYDQIIREITGPTAPGVEPEDKDGEVIKQPSVEEEETREWEDYYGAIPLMKVASITTVSEAQLSKSTKASDKMVSFLQVFSSQKKNVCPTVHNSCNKKTELQTVRKAKIPTNSIFSKFLIPKDTCSGCGVAIDKNRAGICDVCEKMAENTTKRREYREKAVKDLEDLVNARDASDQVCVVCVTKSIGELTRDLIENCNNFECDNWAVRRGTKRDEERMRKQMAPLMDISYE
jgi:DNA polymerase elongation subunit (family B)